jgi:hypothetical protein
MHRLALSGLAIKLSDRRRDGFAAGRLPSDLNDQVYRLRGSIAGLVWIGIVKPRLLGTGKKCRKR